MSDDEEYDPSAVLGRDEDTERHDTVNRLPSSIAAASTSTAVTRELVPEVSHPTDVHHHQQPQQQQQQQCERTASSQQSAMSLRTYLRLRPYAHTSSSSAAHRAAAAAAGGASAAAAVIIRKPIYSVAVRPDGSMLCASGTDGELFMYDFQQPHQGGGGAGVAEASSSSSSLRPTRSMKPFAVHGGQRFQDVRSLSWSADGSYFMAAENGELAMRIRPSGKQETVTAIGSPSMVDVVRNVGHKAPITEVLCSPVDAEKFLTCSLDGTVRLWNAATMSSGSLYAAKHTPVGMKGPSLTTRCPQFTGCFVSSSSFGSSSSSGGAALLATAGESTTVQLWDPRVPYRSNGQALNVVLEPTALSVGCCRSIPLTSDLLLRCGDGSVRRVDLRATSTTNNNSGIGSGAAAAAAGKGEVALLPADTLRYPGDVASMVVSQSGLRAYCGTNKEGLLRSIIAGGGSSDNDANKTMVGGPHAVELSTAQGSLHVAQCRLLSADTEVDVLSVTVEEASLGQLFYGLSNGEIVLDGVNDEARVSMALPARQWMAAVKKRGRHGGVEMDDDDDGERNSANRTQNWAF